MHSIFHNGLKLQLCASCNLHHKDQVIDTLSSQGCYPDAPLCGMWTWNSYDHCLWRSIESSWPC